MLIELPCKTSMLKNGIGASNIKKPVSRLKLDSKLNLIKNFLSE